MSEHEGYLPDEYIIHITKGSHLETRVPAPSDTHGPILSLASGHLRIVFDEWQTFRHFVADLNSTWIAADAANHTTPAPVRVDRKRVRL